MKKYHILSIILGVLIGVSSAFGNIKDGNFWWGFLGGSALVSFITVTVGQWVQRHQQERYDKLVRDKYEDENSDE